MTTAGNTKESWSFIVFCYNEEHSVASVIQKVDDIGGTLAAREYEILIVDDGSTDGSYEAAKLATSNRPRARIIRHERNKGIGEALLTGYREARYDNVCAIPADGQFDVDELLSIQTVPDNSFVSFFRRQQTGYPLYRLILSRFNRSLNDLLFGMRLRDVNWVKVYKRTHLRGLRLTLRTSLVESEICAKLIRAGVRPIEIPSVYLERLSGKSKAVGLKSLMRAGLETFTLARTALWKGR
jgi:glycosyltransferase involved in cell wall biosynthesis